MLENTTLVFAGLVAGLIDSIAGGGGLITLPALSLKLGLGPHAIGTNKIVGAVGAFVALLVYARHTPIPWKTTLAFSGVEAFGAWCGACITPLLPPSAFPLLLAATCPLVLWIVFKKDLWVASEVHLRTVRPLSWGLVTSAFACGVYDGGWGPGGGTFMFLSLFFVVKLPLVTALAASKFANTFSAVSSGTKFALAGYVHFWEGTTVALGMATGALIGSHFASRRAAKLVRPVLIIVVVMLIAKVLASTS